MIQWSFFAHFVLTSICAVELKCHYLVHYWWQRASTVTTPHQQRAIKGRWIHLHTQNIQISALAPKKKDNTPTWAVVVKINIPLLFLFTCSWLINTAFYFGLTTLPKRLTMWCLCIANKSADIQLLCFLTLNRMCVSPSNPNWVIFLSCQRHRLVKCVFCMCCIHVSWSITVLHVLIRKCYIQIKA